MPSRGSRRGVPIFATGRVMKLVPLLGETPSHLPFDSDGKRILYSMSFRCKLKKQLQSKLSFFSMRYCRATPTSSRLLLIDSAGSKDRYWNGILFGFAKCKIMKCLIYLLRRKHVELNNLGDDQPLHYSVQRKALADLEHHKAPTRGQNPAIG